LRERIPSRRLDLVRLVDPISDSLYSFSVLSMARCIAVGLKIVGVKNSTDFEGKDYMTWASSCQNATSDCINVRRFTKRVATWYPGIEVDSSSSQALSQWLNVESVVEIILMSSQDRALKLDLSKTNFHCSCSHAATMRTRFETPE
jgi:hypothetical protein